MVAIETKRVALEFCQILLVWLLLGCGLWWFESAVTTWINCMAGFGLMMVLGGISGAKHERKRPEKQLLPLIMVLFGLLNLTVAAVGAILRSISIL